ncbi:unnamed protein product [Ambrosiozyma monospora]|uniref:Unnamed protein product n=1 Tax=Ambrosiozyma monospora TaxID=43982 RepID=A0A9W6T8Q4_AMBMO|nr:unnamed protein product [Ambrosiozyma monospora]
MAGYKGIETRIVTGEYLERKGDQINYSTEAVLNTTNVDNLGFTIRCNEASDIGNSVGSKSSIIVRSMGIMYPGGDTSSGIPIADCILEHRDNIGVVKTRSNEGRSFESSYLVTYASVGIPSNIFKSIMSKLGSVVKSSDISYEGIKEHEGYHWLNPKISPKPLAVYVPLSDAPHGFEAEKEHLGNHLERHHLEHHRLEHHQLGRT